MTHGGVGRAVATSADVNMGGGHRTRRDTPLKLGEQNSAVAAVSKIWDTHSEKLIPTLKKLGPVKTADPWTSQDPTFSPPPSQRVLLRKVWGGRRASLENAKRVLQGCAFGIPNTGGSIWYTHRYLVCFGHHPGTVVAP